MALAYAIHCRGGSDGAHLYADLLLLFSLLPDEFVVSVPGPLRMSRAVDVIMLENLQEKSDGIIPIEIGIHKGSYWRKF